MFVLEVKDKNLQDFDFELPEGQCAEQMKCDKQQQELKVHTDKEIRPVEMSIFMCEMFLK